MPPASTGTTSRQIAIDSSQRGWKRQPGAGRASEGMLPGMPTGSVSGPRQVRHRREQAARVGVAGAAEQRFCRGVLHDGAGVHHHDAAAGGADHAEVVADQHQREAEAGHQVGDQGEHLALHGDVERRGRFVREQQARVAGQRLGDQHALAHAAGEFVRVAREQGRGIRQAHRSSSARCGRGSRRGRAGRGRAARRPSGCRW